MEEDENRQERLLAYLLAYIVIDNAKSKKEAAYKLSRAGFSNVEIADLMDTTAQNINTMLYQKRKARGKKKKKP